jgi:hypothetical protein
VIEVFQPPPDEMSQGPLEEPSRALALAAFQRKLLSWILPLHNLAVLRMG